MSAKVSKRKPRRKKSRKSKQQQPVKVTAEIVPDNGEPLPDKVVGGSDNLQGMFEINETPKNFYIPSNKRVQVLAMKALGSTYKEIQAATGVSEPSIIRIMRYAPEKEAVMKAMRDAGISELATIIPDVVQGLKFHVKAMDLQALLHVAKGLQLLNPKSELTVEAKGKDEFEGRTAEELEYYIRHNQTWPEDKGKRIPEGKKGGE